MGAVPKVKGLFGVGLDPHRVSSGKAEMNIDLIYLPSCPVIAIVGWGPNLSWEVEGSKHFEVVFAPFS